MIGFIFAVIVLVGVIVDIRRQIKATFRMDRPIWGNWGNVSKKERSILIRQYALNTAMKVIDGYGNECPAIRTCIMDENELLIAGLEEERNKPKV